MCVHIEALNWPPVAIHSLTHTTRAHTHTHLSIFSLSGTLKEKMCVCVCFLHSHSKAHTHMHAELSRHVGSCLCRARVCRAARSSHRLPVERAGTDTKKSVATATHALKKNKNSRTRTSGRHVRAGAAGRWRSQGPGGRGLAGEQPCPSRLCSRGGHFRKDTLAPRVMPFRLSALR